MAIFKIDVDGVLRDIMTPMCKLYNEKFDENIKPEDISEYDVSSTFKKCDDIKNFFFVENAKEVFLNSHPHNYVREALELIHYMGHKIVICTWQFNNTNKKYTLDWLEKHNLFYDDICFTKDKEMINCDVMIDDNPDFLSKEDNDTIKILINSSYNKNVEIEGIRRYNSLYEYVEDAFQIKMYTA